MFLPRSWGNEHLPLLFVAANCDLRYVVAMNNGGAVRIHAKLKPEPPAVGDKPAQVPDKPAK